MSPPCLNVYSNHSRSGSETDLRKSMSLSLLTDSLAELSTSPEEIDICDVPPRSPSRLDFCFKEDFEGPPGLELDSEREKIEGSNEWTYGFLQEISLRDNESDSSTEEGDSSFSVISLSHASDDCSSDDSDSSCSEEDLGSCEMNFPPPPTDMLFHPPCENSLPNVIRPTPRPVSTLNSLSLQSPPRATKSSPRPENTYVHRGLSRNALMHQKWFWNARHEEWLEYQARKDQCARSTLNRAADSVYGGISIIVEEPPCAPPSRLEVPPSGFERDVVVCDHGRYTQDFNGPVYPRIGDVSALRDPYSVNVDRCFFRFPLWTIHKTLYLFDLRQRLAERKCVSHEQEAIPNISDKIPSHPHDSALDSLQHTESDESFSSTSVSPDCADDKNFAERNCTDSQDTISDRLPDHRLRLWEGVRAWELSWYARWELLIGLVQHDQTFRYATAMQHAINHQTTIHNTSATESDGSREPMDGPQGDLQPPLFYFHGEDQYEDDSPDEDEDYGTLMSNPLFSRSFEAGYSRAITFFSGGDAADGKSGRDIDAESGGG